MIRIAAGRAPALPGLAAARRLFAAWLARGARPLTVEDPDGLGYRLVADPLLDVMDADGWYALEHAAFAAPAAAA
jgi:hypothetical protein